MFEPRVPGFLHIDAPDPYRFVPHRSRRQPRRGRRQSRSRRRSCAKAPTPSPRSSPSPSRAPAASSFRRPITSRASARSAIAYDVLLIADEVITGFGRTGRWFGLEHYGIEPDIMQFAKGITSGYVPLGGIGVSDAIRDVINSVPPAQALDARLHLLRPSHVLRGGAEEHRDPRERADWSRAPKRQGRRFARAAARARESLDGVGPRARSLGLIGGVEVVADKTTQAAASARRRA